MYIIIILINQYITDIISVLDMIIYIYNNIYYINAVNETE